MAQQCNSIDKNIPSLTDITKVTESVRCAFKKYMKIIGKKLAIQKNEKTKYAERVLNDMSFLSQHDITISLEDPLFEEDIIACAESLGWKHIKTEHNILTQTIKLSFSGKQ